MHLLTHILHVYMNLHFHTHKAQLRGKRNCFFIQLLVRCTAQQTFSCVCIKESFIVHILKLEKKHLCCNKTVCLNVCYVIIVGRCYCSGFVRADVIDSCAIASLQAHSFMCFFHSSITSVCCYAATPLK